MYSIGLIGCGEVAEHGHLPAILGGGDFRLAATCDLNRRRAELLASRAGGAAHYTDWRELLAREAELDAVVLALPPEISPEVAIECLGRKLAVLDEKPLATTLADGRRLQRAVEQHRGVYQVGFVLRYGQWVNEISRLTAQLGSPLQISVEVYDERLNPDDPAHLARITGFIKTSSAMTHEGSHVIDYVSLWNPSHWTSASAVAKQTSAAFSGPNIWESRINLADRSTVLVRIGWLLPELPPSTVTIVGPAGRLDFDCAAGRGHVELDGAEKSFAAPPLAPEWSSQYAAFAEAIARGHAASATVDDGLRALETTLACELSARTGSAIAPADLYAEAARSTSDCGLVNQEAPDRPVESC
ncbi:MAG: Gfo/Idh/MocA family oxidoreductase [Pirellulales bacterium]|nr:Gfo/Idh/MocA family oxidoreductase [Pirellulales bacterium]